MTLFQTMKRFSAARQVAAARALQLPILVTEQYPKALGATKKLIQDVLPATIQPHPKKSFSMCGEPGYE